MPAGPSARTAARDLAAVGRRFDARGWVAGTSGNFSTVVSRRPLRLAMTRSGAHKGRLQEADFVVIDGKGQLVRAASTKGGTARPSAEAAIHLAIAGLRDAGAILHIHSVWSTILSDRCAAAGGVAIEGYEMLKGLEGVATHEHREWVPIVENSQDMARLAGDVIAQLTVHADAHALLIRRHGSYTWGRTIEDAERQVEILEFLFEALAR
jgi:methylthioribulose-1-phosphate dehydratase